MRTKHAARAFILFALVLGWTAEGFSQTPLKTHTWQDKLKRGALNIVSSPVEIGRQIHITTNEKDLLHGWTVGLAKGLGEGCMRLGAGAVDFLTFPFNFPDKEKKPLLEPEYVWEKSGPKYA